MKKSPSKTKARLAELQHKLGAVDTKQLSLEGAPKGLFVQASAGGLERDLAEAVLVEKLSDLLTQRRRQKHLTMQQMGELLGISKGRVSQLESQDVNLRIDTFVRYIQALDADVEIRVIPKKSNEKPLAARLG